MKYKFSDMAVGDRITVTGTEPEVHLAWNAARQIAFKKGWKFRYVHTEGSLRVIRISKKYVPPSEWGPNIKLMLEGDILDFDTVDLDKAAREVHDYGRVKNKRFLVWERQGIVYVQRVTLEDEILYWQRRKTKYPFEELRVDGTLPFKLNEAREVKKAVCVINKHRRARYTTYVDKGLLWVKRVA